MVNNINNFNIHFYCLIKKAGQVPPDVLLHSPGQHVKVFDLFAFSYVPDFNFHFKEL